MSMLTRLIEERKICDLKSKEKLAREDIKMEKQVEKGSVYTPDQTSRRVTEAK